MYDDCSRTFKISHEQGRKITEKKMLWMNLLQRSKWLFLLCAYKKWTFHPLLKWAKWQELLLTVRTLHCGKIIRLNPLLNCRLKFNDVLEEWSLWVVDFMVFIKNRYSKKPQTTPQKIRIIIYSLRSRRLQLSQEGHKGFLLELVLYLTRSSKLPWSCHCLKCRVVYIYI